MIFTGVCIYPGLKATNNGKTENDVLLQLLKNRENVIQILNIYCYRVESEHFNSGLGRK